jgi:ABC-2 type transport system permease protein
MPAETAPSDGFVDDGATTTTVARLTARRAVRSGALWGYVFGLLVASSALSYSTIYKTEADRARLAATFSSNHAAAALFGPGIRLQTVAGFTVYKSSMTAIVVGAVWGLLVSTRLLRGEEDAGRWEMLLSGRTTRGGATAQGLAGLAAGLAVLWAIAAAIVVVVGRSSRVHVDVTAALFFAVELVAAPVMFVAVGALTSQLGATRRRAAAIAAVFLGVGYAVRLLADAGVGAHWLVWLSPIGWVEELQPLTSPDPTPLIAVAAFAVALSLLAVGLAARRDCGASTFPDRSTARPRLGLLKGPTGLTVRLVRPVVVGWLVALVASGFVLGIVAKAAGTTIAGSSVQKVFSRLGATGTGAAAFLGVSFLIVAVLVAFVAAGQITAARGEEADGHLDHLFARPVRRLTWYGGRILVAASALLLGGVVAGASTWLGAAAEHAGVGLSTLLGAGVNTAAPAICVLGIGALALGLWPRTSRVLVYAVVGWSLLVELVGGLGGLDHWIADTSVFHQMASAPAVPVAWSVDAALVGVGIVCAVVGALCFSARDLQGE